MNPADLQALLAQLAENSAKMNQLLERNPEKEFAYKEGNVGATPDLSVSPKLDCQGLVLPIAQSFGGDGTGSRIFVANGYTKRIRIRWGFEFGSNAGTTSLISAAILRVEFSDKENFAGSQRTWILPCTQHRTYGATITVNDTNYATEFVPTFDREWFIRARYVRITLVTRLDVPITTVLNATPLFYNGIWPLVVEFDGE